MRSLRIASAVAALGLLASPCAADEPPLRRSRTSVALLSGYGFQLDSTLWSGMSAYRFGFGTRAGVTLPFGAYVGGTFVTHVGTNVAGVRDGSSAYVGIAHATYVGPEAGFDLERGGLLVRPYVGTGLLLSLGKTAVATADVSDNRALLYVAPGGLIAYRFAALFAGADLRFTIAPAQSYTQWAPTAMLTLGTTFGGGSATR